MSAIRELRLRFVQAPRDEKQFHDLILLATKDEALARAAAENMQRQRLDRNQ
jgi:hypothetical protein